MADSFTNHPLAAMDSRLIAHQPQSPLLRLPTELRLQICSYLTPTLDTGDWYGAFFSCRQLYTDILSRPRPVVHVSNRDLASELGRQTASRLPQLYGWLRSVRITLPIALGWPSELHKLYALPLDELQVLLTHQQPMFPRANLARNNMSAHPIELWHGDLKSVRPPYLPTQDRRPRERSPDECIINSAVNCKKITLTLDELAQEPGARARSTSYQLQLADTGVTYLFTIVQNGAEEQIERSYTFGAKFKMVVPVDVAPTTVLPSTVRPSAIMPTAFMPTTTTQSFVILAAMSTRPRSEQLNTDLFDWAQ